jgi:fumarate hydratase class II
MRTESDALGSIKIPEDSLWGISTERSRNMFAIGQEMMPFSFIQHYALYKSACASVNEELNLIEKQTAKAIRESCSEIIDGQHQEAFPLSVWQSGSGTQTNMNLNEVIANRSNQLLGHALGKKSPVHPNDHVNLSQSSNDSFPVCMHLLFSEMLENQVLPALIQLRDTLKNKQIEFKDLIHIGRTHLQDALPVSFTQNLQCYIDMTEEHIRQLEKNQRDLMALPTGGTAVGSGFGAPKDFGEKLASKIAKLTQQPFKASPNPSSQMSQHHALLNLSSTLSDFSACYHKLVNDLRLLGSGPRAGLSELILPSNELGSSIMPGKINPTQCESAAMICLSVQGNHQIVTNACANGHLELNTYKPLILYALYQSCDRLSHSVKSLSQNCLKGLKVNTNQCEKSLKNSLMLITALRPHIGYDDCAKVATYAYENNLSLKEAIIQLSIMDVEDFDTITNPKNMF